MAEVAFPPIEIPEPVLEIARKLEGAGFEAWCVGGNLRDAFLQQAQSDYDIATSATPEQVQKLFPRTVEVGIKYGTVGVLDRARRLHEVTTFRRDVATDGRHAVVAYGVSLEEDLARRDFTINALAYHPLRHEWKDPFDGAGDLARQLVRAVGDPAQRFQEDYLRVLRALRFAARFDFTIDPLTWEAARAAAGGLSGLSAERVRDEWFKSLRTARSITQLLMLWLRVGAARVWIPELEVARPSQMAYPDPPLENRDPVLLTALVCPNPAAVLRRLKASNAEIARASGLELGPEEPAALDPVAVRRWLATVGPAAAGLSALWALRHGGPAPWSVTMAEVRLRGDPLTRSDLAIHGGDLQELGIQGPRVGETLAALLDRVLNDPTLNTRPSLLAIAREIQ
ncbi:MAG TPA: CCA tRNA nucleotidyltransferase [Gemmatimonadales bacterium]|nr:CCA tRNA nucleotidyltransferase [Gemmatimonadales bacterium]